MTANHPPTSIEALLAEREWVRNLAASLVADPNRADDVAQDAWLAAVTRPPDDGSSPRGWLGAVVRNWAKRGYRGEGRRRLREMAVARPEAMPSAAEMVARAEAHRHVVDAVIGLAEPYRSTVLARFFEDMPPREIARRMEVPVETVRTRLKRGLAQLRELLDAKYGGDRRSWGLALAPLAVKGGVLVKTTTKTGIAVAAVLLLAGAAAFWTVVPEDDPVVADAAPVAPPSVASAAPAPPVAPPPAPAPEVPAGTASVRGEVWFASPERPAPGVAVTIGPSGSAKSVRTDEVGRFRLDGLPAGFRGAVRFRHERLAEVARTVMPLREGEVLDVGILRLAAPASAEVLVLTFDGSPVEGVDVEAVRSPARTFSDPVFDTLGWRDVPEPHAHGVTDADGRVRFDRLEPDAWTFVAVKRGFLRGSSLSVPLAAGEVAGPVRLRLGRGLPLAGRVIDGAGRGVAGVTVWAQPKSGYGNPDVMTTLPRATSDADGAFAFDALTPGTHEMRVQIGAAPLVTAATVRVPASAPVEIRLAGRRIVGAVREAGSAAPIPGARVRATAVAPSSIVETTSGPDGRFVLDTVIDVELVTGIHVAKAGFVEVPDPVRTKVPYTDPGLWLRRTGDTPLDLVMRRGAKLTGRVTADGVPLRGASVLVHRRRAAAAQATTDADGRYVVDGIERGLALVQVTSAAHVQTDWSFDSVGQFWSGQEVAGTIAIPETGEIVRDVTMERGVVVSGRVVTADGAPAAGCQVMGINVDRVTCGADGAFRVVASTIRGRAWVSAQHPDLGWAGFDAEIPQSRAIEDAEIRLKPYPRLKGRVTAGSGELHGAWVEAANLSPGSPEPWWGNSRPRPVDADGAFDVAVFATEGVMVRAGAEGLCTVTVPATRTSDGSFTVEIRLDRGARVSGRAVIGGSREPCAGAEVVLTPKQRSSEFSKSAAPLRYEVVAALTAADGGFALEGVAPGRQFLRVQKDGFIAAETEIDVPTQGELVVELTAGAEIAGTVTFSDGAPLVRGGVSATRSVDDAQHAGGKRRIWYGIGVTDEAGRYTIRSLPEGAFDLSVGPWSSQEKFANVDRPGVAVGSRGVDFTVERLATGLRLRGRVVGADGTPVARATVNAHPASGKAFGNATTRGDGTFEIEGLDPVAYTVSTSPPAGTRFADVGVWFGVRWLSVRTEGVRPPRDDVVVMLPLGETIEGVVVDASGQPARSVWVSIGMPPDPSDPRGRTSGPLADETDGDGRFEITGLPPGSTWRLVEPGFRGLRDPAPLAGGENVRAGTRGLRLTFGSFAKLRGVVVDAAGAPVAGANVRAYGPRGAERSATSGATGEFEIGSLDAGSRVDVVAWVGTFAPTTISAVNAGSEGLRIELREGRRVAGRLLGRDGKPLAQTKIVLRTSACPVASETSTDREGRFTATGLLAAPYRAAYVGLVDHTFRELSCGTLDADASEAELRAE